MIVDDLQQRQQPGEQTLHEQAKLGPGSRVFDDDPLKPAPGTGPGGHGPGQHRPTAGGAPTSGANAEAKRAVG